MGNMKTMRKQVDMFSKTTKCTACGATMTFPQTVCPMCGTKHDMFRATIHLAISPLPEIRESGYEHSLWTDLCAWAHCYDAMSDPPPKIAVSTEAMREIIATIVAVRKELAAANSRSGQGGEEQVPNPPENKEKL